MTLPDVAAVLDVLAQQRVVEARVGKLDGHGEVDAASGLDLLREQVASVLGAAGLAEKLHDAVGDRDDGLDGEQLAERGGRCRDAPATAEELERVEKAHHMDVLAGLLERARDVDGTEALAHKAQRVVHEDALAHRDALAVHDVDAVLEGRGRGHGARVGAGKLAGKRNDHDLLARLARRGDGLLEGIGIHLAGHGQVVTLDE